MMMILLKVCITGGILLFIFSQVDHNKIFNIVNDLNVFLLLVSLLILVLQVVASAFRWYLMLKIKNIAYTFFDTLKLTWLGLFFNQVLPTGIGGDVIRVHQLNKKCTDLGSSVSSVFWDRLTGLFGLGILILLGIPMIAYTGLNSLVLISISIIGALVIGFLFVLYFERISLIRGFGFSISLNHLSRDGRLFLLKKENSIKVLSLSVIIQSLSIVSVYLIVVSTGVFVDILALLVVVPMSIITMALPISIAGWGVREGVMVFGLSLLGVNIETSLLISVIYGVQLMLVSLPGSVYWIFYGNENKSHG